MSEKKCITIHFDGGLGNSLFQLAAAMHFAEKWGRVVAFKKDYDVSNPHTKNSFLSFLNPSAIERLDAAEEGEPDVCIYENENDLFIYKPFETPPEHCKLVHIQGFFQNEKYVMNNAAFQREVIDTLLVPRRDGTWIPYDRTFFIHVRLGDYLISSLHRVDLRKKYLQVALQLLRERVPGARFRVYSNDLNAARKWTEFKNKPDIDFADVPGDWDCLRDMAKCLAGGICWNSTFSWWAAYAIPNPDKLVTFPSVWLNDQRPVDIYFDKSFVIPV